MRNDAWRDPWAYFFVLGALGNLANGMWMLADPSGWYHGLPAAVPDTGPLNEHFVRDIGAAFTTQGAGLLWGALVPAVRVPVLAMVALFYVLHALIHVYDTLRGLLAADHWLIDFPGVYLPALVLAVLTVAASRTRAVAR